MITFRPSAKFDKKAAIVLVDAAQMKKQVFVFKNSMLVRQLKVLQASGQFCGQKGEVFPLMVQDRLVLCVGLGKALELSLTDLRRLLRKALLSAHLNKMKSIEVLPHEDEVEVVKALIEAIYLGTYQWCKYKTVATKESIPTADKHYVIVASKHAEYARTIAVCGGVTLTRDLINDNADVVTSIFVEQTVRDLIKGNKQVSLEVLNEKTMKAKGLGFHLAVNQGSLNEPRLIIVKYRGAEKDDPYTALIGKGMTFDTGGLNLKGSGHIETMRIDMSGAAAVVGTLKNVLDLKLEKNILFVCGMAENAIGSGAYKPGDVITGYAGKTAEIANTDAEGRLVLADAIAYVVKNYVPARLIDIATLTGACVVALGYNYTGLMSNDADFAQELLTIAHETDDRAWELPMHPELKEAVKSPIADICNLGKPRGAAGTLTAAEFLRQFTEDTPWVHLDIAGTSFVEGRERFYFGHGATGAGVRLMTRYLMS